MLKQLVLLVLINSFLFSNIDYTDVYRQNGIKAVEKLLSKELQKETYWKESLKNKNINNGYYESLKYVLVCNKNLSDINVYDASTNKLLYKSSVITGQNKGSKNIEGDLKTPVGSYKLLKKLQNLDSFYGPFALSTNYPNKFDKSLGKTGHGIWIHGVPFKEERKPFTKGCIALENDNLQMLSQNINLKQSMLIISENKKTNTSLNQISIILSNIFQWRDAWKYGDFKQYLSFYSKEFKKANGSGFEKFKAYKSRIFAKNEEKQITFTNINIIPYPNNLNKIMFKVSMHEDYKTKTYTFTGKKELYLELINNKMKILFE